tara:strand:+ start:1307 stop:1528 length:222 start_codon:yes stop_codon:yes gene_type:complete
MNHNKHIWEGWTVGDFIEELEPQFDIITSNSHSFQTAAFQSRDAVRKWCKENQPYYKKHIPEVANYFIKKARL